MSSSSGTVTEADRHAIAQCIYRYCRAIDRGELEALTNLYWPGAVDDHDPFVGPVEQFIPWAREILANMEQTHHFVGNMLMDFHDGWAAVETYIHAYHRIRSDEGTVYDLVTAGRYLDRMEKRGDEWRIAYRQVVRDWYRRYPDSADWTTGAFGTPMKAGLRSKDDPSYLLFAGALGA
jgi:ketosteroid isomerase-like protein